MILENRMYSPDEVEKLLESVTKKEENILVDKPYSPLEVLTYTERYAESRSKRQITEAVRVTLRTMGILKPTMNRSEAEHEAGSRRKVANALRDGSLRCVKKGRNVIINRDDFESWLKENEFN